MKHTKNLTAITGLPAKAHDDDYVAYFPIGDYALHALGALTDLVGLKSFAAGLVGYAVGKSGTNNNSGNDCEFC